MILPKREGGMEEGESDSMKKLGRNLIELKELAE